MPALVAPPASNLLRNFASTCIVPALLMLAGLPALAQTMNHSSMASTEPPPGERLGTVSFSVSCAAASQAPFNRGVAMLHDFWYTEAQAQFERLIKADPTCAMAHWGLAMSVFHQIWNRPNAQAMRLGWLQIKKAQSHPPSTDRERAYVASLSGFYHPGKQDFPARINAYSAAMAKIYAKYPEDVDAGAFYALSLLAAQAPDDASIKPQQQAMSVLAPLFAKYPDNPGVVHYIIHACDNPQMAADGLAAANHYGEIAQSGPHAFHMPGHIYARLGLWPQDIASQVGSVAASNSAEAHGESGIMDEPHSYDFLLYAYLQSGQDAKAKQVLEQVSKTLTSMESMPDMGSRHMGGMVPYYRKEIPAFYALEMRDWNSAAALEPAPGAPPTASTLVYWARALAHGRLHQPAAAQADLARYDALMATVKKGKNAYMAEGTFNQIERGEMLAWIAFADQKPTEALNCMRTAADLQDKVGQGEVDIPAREMLADMLLEMGQAKDALTEYEAALKLSPNRLNGLYNAGRAAQAAGDKTKAASYYSALLKSTNNGADSTRPELLRAKAFISAD